MENSTKTTLVNKVTTAKPKKNNNLEKIVELNERMNYVVKMLQDHAEEIITIRSKLDKVLNRMGL